MTNNDIALVTGASRGIGRAIAFMANQAGANFKEPEAGSIATANKK